MSFLDAVAKNAAKSATRAVKVRPVQPKANSAFQIHPAFQAAQRQAARRSQRAVAKLPKQRVSPPNTPKGGVFGQRVGGAAPFRQAQHAQARAVRRAAQALPPEHKAKLFPVLANPTPHQKRVLVKLQSHALFGTDFPSKSDVQGALQTADNNTRTQLHELAKVASSINANRSAKLGTSLTGVTGTQAQREKALTDFYSTRQAKPGPKQDKLDIAGVDVGHVLGGVKDHVTTGLTPALAALKIAAAPAHMIAGGADAAVKGQSVTKGAVKGIDQNTTFSNVLKDAGVKSGFVRGVGGFGLDVALDPTTYVAPGAASLAKEAAKSEFERVSAKALAAGMKPEGAKAVATRAAQRAAEKAGPKKQLVIGTKNHKIAMTPAFGGEAKGPGGSVRQAVEHVASSVSPRHVPQGVKPAEHVAMKRATREQRAITGEGEQNIITRNRALSKAIGDAGKKLGMVGSQAHNLVQDALEGTTVRDGKSVRFGLRQLPDELRPLAQRIRDDQRFTRRMKARAGVGGNALRVHGLGNDAQGLAQEAKGYASRVRRDSVDPKFLKKGGILRPSKSASVNENRTIREPLSVVRQRDASLFVDDPALASGVRSALATRRVGQAHVYQALLNTGRKLTARTKGTFGAPAEGEAIYHFAPKATPRKLAAHGADRVEAQRAMLTPVERADLRRRAADLTTRIAAATDPQAARALTAQRHDLLTMATPPKAGQYAVLNEKLADKAIEASAPREVNAASTLYDRTQGKLKTALTVVRPAYHGRNLVGDLQNAYLHFRPDEIAVNLKHASKALNALRHVRKAAGSIEPSAGQVKAGAGLNIGGKFTTYDDIARRGLKVGAVDTGLYGHDIPEMIQRARGTSGPIEHARAFGQGRENLVRLSTFIGGLRQGMTDQEAADLVTHLHFDYGDISNMERGLRRFFPFYTFSARNTPLQARKLLTSPSKAAHIELAREELAKGAGLPTDNKHNYEKKLQKYEQFGVPVPVPGLKLGGKQALSYSSLPLVDLNRLTLKPGEQWDQVAQMLTGFKAPIELHENHSFFFHGPIDNGTPVHAPDWVGNLPDWAKKKLGAVQKTDRQSGKKQWFWNAKADYVAKQLPQSSFLLNMTTSGGNRRGQSRAAQFAGSTGVRLSPYDPSKKVIADLYTKRQKLQAQLNNFDAGDPRRSAINKQVAAINKQLAATSKQAGYKIPLGVRGKGAKSAWQNFQQGSSTQSEWQKFQQSQSGSGSWQNSK